MCKRLMIMYSCCIHENCDVNICVLTVRMQLQGRAAEGDQERDSGQDHRQEISTQ